MKNINITIDDWCLPGPATQKYEFLEMKPVRKGLACVCDVCRRFRVSSGAVFPPLPAGPRAVNNPLI